MPFLSQRKEKQKYVTGPGIEPGSSGSSLRRATDWPTRPGHEYTINVMRQSECLVLMLVGWLFVA